MNQNYQLNQKYQKYQLNQKNYPNILNAACAQKDTTAIIKVINVSHALKMNTGMGNFVFNVQVNSIRMVIDVYVIHFVKPTAIVVAVVAIAHIKTKMIKCIVLAKDIV